MKKALTLVALLFITFAGCKNDDNTVVDNTASNNYKIQTIQDGSLTIYNIDKFNSTIVKIPRISAYIYSRYPSTFVKTASDSSFSLMINASFFDSRPDGYFHAGYLKIQNQVISGYKTDQQLNRIFAYSSSLNIVKNLSTAEVNQTSDYDLVFQTGPQIINKNKIDSASIDASINGNGGRYRTAFASVDDKVFYVIITRETATLKELGKMLIECGIFKGELNVINFDGGPSTALYLKNEPGLNFNFNTKLPVLLGVK